MKRTIGLVCLFLLVAVIAGIVGQQIGFFQGAQRIGKPSAEAMANAVYRLASRREFAAIVSDGLGVEAIAEALKKADAESGAVRAWKVVQVQPTPILLPTIVEIEVKRNSTGREFLVIHSPFRFHDYWPADPARNLNGRLKQSSYKIGPVEHSTPYVN